jgi:hypothetical protein
LGLPSQSEADLALFGLLAFYTSDAAQLDRLFRQSALYREKWDEWHGGRPTARGLLGRCSRPPHEERTIRRPTRPPHEACNRPGLDRVPTGGPEAMQYPQRERPQPRGKFLITIPPKWQTKFLVG